MLSWRSEEPFDEFVCRAGGHDPEQMLREPLGVGKLPFRDLRPGDAQQAPNAVPVKPMLSRAPASRARRQPVWPWSFVRPVSREKQHLFPNG
jgi:hypothetical protein